MKGAEIQRIPTASKLCKDRSSRGNEALISSKAACLRRNLSLVTSAATTYRISSTFEAFGSSKASKLRRFVALWTYYLRQPSFQLRQCSCAVAQIILSFLTH